MFSCCCCESMFGSASSIQKKAIIESNRIDHEQMKAKSHDRRVIKLLLLGTGESGKSTFHKQMQLLYGTGFSSGVRNNYKSIIRKNLIESMQALILAVRRFEWNFSNEEQEEAADAIMDVDVLSSDFWHRFLVGHVHTLWDSNSTTHSDDGTLKSSSCIHRAYSLRSKFQVSDSAEYFFDRVDAIGSASYEPTDSDILRARLRTTGIVESIFTIDRIPFRITDVGGQRNERRKWIHCFQDTTALLFVAAINEYDQVLYEDDRKNRLHESLDCFGDIVSNPVFASTAIILFLNKKDLFLQKIRDVDMKVCFPEFTGGNDSEKAMAFVKRKFLQRLRSGSNYIYVHFTIATDTKNIERVWNDCRTIILRRNLEMSGLGLSLGRISSAMSS